MAVTYHFWLKPSGKAYDILKKTIAELGVRYQAPFFEPHVTLLSSLPGTEEEILLRSWQLGRSLQPFDLQLTHPAHGNQYFQCVFLKIQETPALINAHEEAKRLFEKEITSYMPHLSLLYGNYSSGLKEQIVTTLPETLSLTFTIDKIDLIHAASEDPQDWNTILTVPLGQ